MQPQMPQPPMLQPPAGRGMAFPPRPPIMQQQQQNGGGMSMNARPGFPAQQQQPMIQGPPRPPSPAPAAGGAQQPMMRPPQQFQQQMPPNQPPMPRGGGAFPPPQQQQPRPPPIGMIPTSGAGPYPQSQQQQQQQQAAQQQPRPPFGNLQPPRGSQPPITPGGPRPPFLPQQQQQPQQQQFGVPRGPQQMMAPQTPQQPLQPHAPGFTPQHHHHQMMGSVHPTGMAATAPMLAARGGNIVIDPINQCPKEYCKLTFEKFPESEIVRQRAGNLPLAAVFRPFCDLEGSPPVPIVNFGANPVVRCRRCRSYISPFAFFVEGGKRWQCALCWNVNDVEPDYFCPINPETGKRRDYAEKGELISGVIDIIAPDEYTLRPPTPPAFLFVIDVSKDAVASGLLQAASIAIKRCLSRLPGEPRTQVGFITFDTEIHFYDLNGGPERNGGPRMLVVSDLNQIFHPTSTDDLLVDLKERRHAIDTLLDQLPTMHHGMNSESALGPAVEAAYDIIAPLGGKISIFQVQLPMMVDSVTAPTSDEEKDKAAGNHGGLPKPGRGSGGVGLGGPTEHEFFRPASTWYAQKSEAFCRQHISLDWYCCTSSYCDLATCAELCHSTAGRLRYYPKFHAHRDGELINDVYRSLTSLCASEAVMRVRASTGVRVSRFYGSFTMRARDLLALPQSDPDGVYGFEFAYEEELLAGKFIALQSAVLYTTLNGERRIRVTNQAVPLSQNPVEIMQGMQPDVVCAVLFKRACEEARESTGGMDQARNQLKVTFWKMLEQPQFAAGNPQIIELLARNIIGIMKSPTLRGGSDVGYDERYYLLRLIGRASIERINRIMLPKLYAISPTVGSSPREVPLTRQSLSQDSIFFLDNGLQIMIWIGSKVPPQVFSQLFGSQEDAQSLRLVPPLPQGENPVKSQIWALVHSIRKVRLEDFTPIVIVREGDMSVEPRFYWSFINDPASFRGGEITVEELIARGSKAAQAAAAMPPGARPPSMQQHGMPSAAQQGMPGAPPGGFAARPPPGPGGSPAMPPGAPRPPIAMPQPVSNGMPQSQPPPRGPMQPGQLPRPAFTGAPITPNGMNGAGGPPQRPGMPVAGATQPTARPTTPGAPQQQPPAMGGPGQMPSTAPRPPSPMSQSGGLSQGFGGPSTAPGPAGMPPPQMMAGRGPPGLQQPAAGGPPRAPSPGQGAPRPAMMARPPPSYTQGPPGQAIARPPPGPPPSQQQQPRMF